MTYIRTDENALGIVVRLALRVADEHWVVAPEWRAAPAESLPPEPAHIDEELGRFGFRVVPIGEAPGPWPTVGRLARRHLSRIEHLRAPVDGVGGHEALEPAVTEDLEKLIDACADELESTQFARVYIKRSYQPAGSAEKSLGDVPSSTSVSGPLSRI